MPVAPSTMFLVLMLLRSLVVPSVVEMVVPPGKVVLVESVEVLVLFRVSASFRMLE